MPGATPADLSADAVLFGRLGDRETAIGVEARLAAMLDPKRMHLDHHFQQLVTDQGVFSGTWSWGARLDSLPSALLPDESKAIRTDGGASGHLVPMIKDTIRMLNMSDWHAWQDRCRLEPIDNPSGVSPVLEKVCLLKSTASVGTVDVYHRQAVEKLVAGQSKEAEWRHVQTETEYYERLDGEERLLIQRRRYLVLFDETDQVLGWVDID